jgi:PKD repeat protein
VLVRAGPTAPFNFGIGELLVNGVVLFDISLPAHASGITNFGFGVPSDLSLMGMGVAQGLILGVPDQTFCNAIDLRIGFGPPDPVPAADFSASTTLGPAPLAVSFTDLSTGPITSWNWDFGDGGSSTLQNPSHTYNSVGIYSLVLRATGPGGLDIETKFDHIEAQ